MDKSFVRNLFIEWLNDINNHDVAMRFIYHWVKYKIPDINEEHLRKFNGTLDLLSHIPFSPYANIVVGLIELVKIELEINTIIKTQDYNQIIKYY